jgi:hypothetical protein
LGHLAALLRSSDHYDEYRRSVTDPALGPQINSKITNMPRLLIGDPKKIFDEEFDINEQHYIIPQIQGVSDVKSIVDDKTKLINYIGEIFDEAVTTANKVIEMKVEDSDFIKRQLELMIESKEIICKRLASFQRIDERALIKAFEGLLYKNAQSVPFSIRLENAVLHAVPGLSKAKALVSTLKPVEQPQPHFKPKGLIYNISNKMLRDPRMIGELNCIHPNLKEMLLSNKLLVSGVHRDSLTAIHTLLIGSLTKPLKILKRFIGLILMQRDAIPDYRSNSCCSAIISFVSRVIKEQKESIDDDDGPINIETQIPYEKYVKTHLTKE